MIDETIMRSRTGTDHDRKEHHEVGGIEQSARHLARDPDKASPEMSGRIAMVSTPSQADSGRRHGPASRIITTVITIMSHILICLLRQYNIIHSHPRTAKGDHHQQSPPIAHVAYHATALSSSTRDDPSASEVDS
jgi:hypothetical protein